MKLKAKEEYVMAFPADLLRTLGYFQGLRLEPARYLSAIESKASFRPRPAVETDPLFKQLIPYVIITFDGSVLSYRRGARSSEDRLTGNRSIGIGGHVSVTDPNLFSSSYSEGMNRELREELRIDSAYAIRPVAMLNDDSNEVGRVHFGLIHVLVLNEPRVTRNEQAISDLKFLSKEQLSKSIEEYESWSQICIGQLALLLGSAESRSQ
jgi:predicted NUDIX family phosphoesterase